jgi:hypothetical protein
MIGLGSGSNSYFVDAINPNGDQHLHGSSSTEYMSMTSRARRLASPSGHADGPVKAGQTAYSASFGPSASGGDYSGITIDLTDGSFWRP